MPRYFFHTADSTRDRDTSGVELPSHHAARVEAIRFAGKVISEEPDHLWKGRDFRVEVTDRNGLLLFTIVTLAFDAPASGANQN